MSEAADFIPVDKVRAIQNMQKGAGNLRDALLWTAGPNWALRVSDLLAVTVGDVRGPAGVRKAFAVKQQKTSKTVTCDITPKIGKAIEAYLSNGHPEPGNSDAPLFPSRCLLILSMLCISAGMSVNTLSFIRWCRYRLVSFPSRQVEMNVSWMCPRSWEWHSMSSPSIWKPRMAERTVSEEGLVMQGSRWPRTGRGGASRPARPWDRLWGTGPARRPPKSVPNGGPGSSDGSP